MNDPIEVSVLDLKGPALDYAVAIAEGMRIHTPEGMQFKYWYKGERCVCSVAGYSPSESWNDGGPLIESNRIALVSYLDGTWIARHPLEVNEDLHDIKGSHALEAACRSIVASKFGFAILIPKELRRD